MNPHGDKRGQGDPRTRIKPGLTGLGGAAGRCEALQPRALAPKRQALTANSGPLKTGGIERKFRRRRVSVAGVGAF